MKSTLKAFPLIVLTIFSCNAMEQSSNALTEFDRETYTDAEGYWASSEDSAHDQYKGKYPFPKTHAQEWSGKHVFLEKLATIESTSKDFNFFDPEIKTGVYKFAARGCALSRLESNVELGNGEFQYLIKESKEAKIETVAAWTDVFGSYYVRKFNVKPSRAFYDFVMKFKAQN